MNGAIKWMAEHPVAATMVMVLAVLVGALSAFKLPQMTFPEFDLDTVTITVSYQGTAPDEISRSIVQPIEERLASVDGIDEITATAREGMATVTISFIDGEDTLTKLDEIKTEIDRITVFPEDADEPTVVRSSSLTRVIELVVHGHTDFATLSGEAERLKEELTLLDGISFVETAYMRDPEIQVEIDRDTLAAYRLTLQDVAQIIERNALELPGGDVNSATVSVPLRTVGRRFTADEYGDIVIRSDENGARVLLRDIATITDGFEDTDIAARFGGEQAVTVKVFRVGDEQVLDIATTVESFISSDFRASLPAGVNVTVWQNEADVLQSRLDILVKNAFVGFFLVVICLALFLDVRLAFWSASNIAVAFAGTLIVMSLFDISINMISLFGFILAIGIVVDNAIVISENIFKNGEKGVAPLPAAVSGAQRVAVPVVFSALTTIVAFTPLIQMPAPLGNFLIDIPLIVIVVLTLSLLQSLFVLPRNLSRLNFGADYRAPLAFRPLGFLRRNVDSALQWFIHGPIDAALRFATRRFLVPIAGVIAAMILAVGLLAHGYVKFEFFPSIDGEYVIANIDMVDGTSLARTDAVAGQLREAATRAGDAMSAEKGMARPIIEGINIVIGRGAAGGGPFGGAPSEGTSFGHVVAKIVSPEHRDWPAAEFEMAWIAEIGDIAGLNSLMVFSTLVNAGDPISLEMSVPEGTDVASVVSDVRDTLRAIPGVFGIQDDTSTGRLEYRLALRDEARLYGVTLADLAQQVRAGFFGLEATRVQRGDDDVQVTVRLPEGDRESLDDLLQTTIRAAGGALIPVSAVATIEEGVAPSEIIRRNGRTIATVTADVDTSIVTAQEANTIIREDLLPALDEKYRGLIVEFGGEQRTLGETQAALGQAAGIALFVVFALLALIFRSYVQPIVVMLAIPLGLIGAVLGHYILGVSLGLLSIFGIIGLSGVVINNSLVMIDLYNEYLDRGWDTRTAVIEGTKDRFRPILLTSITTFLGVYPLIMETSLQAQFLIPLAVSIGFGVLFGAIVVVFAIPAIFIAQSRLFFTYKEVGEADLVSGDRTGPGAQRRSPTALDRKSARTGSRSTAPVNDDVGLPEAAE